MVEPLFYHSFAIRAGHANYGQVVFLAVAFGQALQSFERAYYQQEVGIGVVRFIIGWHIAYNKVAYAAAV